MGGCNCFHDWGIQVYDGFNRGPWELSYAAMVSNGGEIENLTDQVIFVSGTVGSSLEIAAPRTLTVRIGYRLP